MKRHTTAGPFSPAPATSKATACAASWTPTADLGPGLIVGEDIPGQAVRDHHAVILRWPDR